MDHVSNRADLDGLRAEIARIESEPSFDFAAAVAVNADGVVRAAREVAPLADELPPVVGQFDEAEPLLLTEFAEDPDREPFGAWLLKQDKRKDWIADLAKAAKSDPRFPKRGSPDDVRKRLTEFGAEGDMFEAVDDAELDWASL